MAHGDRREARRNDVADNLHPPVRLDMDVRSALEPYTSAAPRLAVLGEMTGGIAHDFRNILAVIDSCLNLAERSIDEPERLLYFLAGAREGVTSGLRLTTQLLSLARRDETQTCVEDVNSLLKQLDPLLECGAGPSVHVALDLCPTIPSCLVDPSQFSGAILNLVLNARDAMPNGGEVRISTARCNINRGGNERSYVRVRIQDNGVGMPEQVAKKISEPFFTTKGDRGTGLGVPQVFTLMRQSGGEVRVTSVQSKGTTFDLLFPAIGPELPTPHADRRAALC